MPADKHVVSAKRNGAEMEHERTKKNRLLHGKQRHHHLADESLPTIMTGWIRRATVLGIECRLAGSQYAASSRMICAIAQVHGEWRAWARVRRGLGARHIATYTLQRLGTRAGEVSGKP